MAGGSPYDLWYDPNTVDGDLVVECWISHGPRAKDGTFDPQPGDEVLVGDDEEPVIAATVLRRNGNRVAVKLDLSDDALGGIERAAASG